MTSSESLVGPIAANGDAPTPGGGVHQTADEQYFGHEHVTVIEPIKGWRSLDLKELWAYRELSWVLTARDVKVRYKQTVLGFAWAIIQPVMTDGGVLDLLRRLRQDAVRWLPLSDLRLCGAAALDLLCQRHHASQATSLVGSAHLVSKVYFPRLIIPLSSVGAGLSTSPSRRRCCSCSCFTTAWLDH